MIKYIVEARRASKMSDGALRSAFIVLSSSGLGYLGRGKKFDEKLFLAWKEKVDPFVKKIGYAEGVEKLLREATKSGSTVPVSQMAWVLNHTYDFLNHRRPLD